MTRVGLHVDDRGSGVPLVLLHAFPLSSAMWSAQQADLSGGHRVLTPDLPGFGASPLADDAPDLDLLADDVAGLLDDRGIYQAVVVGLSMGGYVSMAFVRRHVHRLLGLVLADTKASADTAQAAANRRRIADVLEATDTVSVLLDEVLPTLTADETKVAQPAVQERVRAMVEAAPPAAAAWAQRAMAGRPDSFDTLRGLEVPTLVLVGDRDGLTPPSEARLMAEALPHGRLVVLPRSGHLSAMESPGAFTAAMRDFLAEAGLS